MPGCCVRPEPPNSVFTQGDTRLCMSAQRLITMEFLTPKMKSHVEDKTESGNCDRKILIYLKFC